MDVRKEERPPCATLGELSSPRTTGDWRTDRERYRFQTSLGLVQRGVDTTNDRVRQEGDVPLGNSLVTTRLMVVEVLEDKRRSIVFSSAR